MSLDNLKQYMFLNKFIINNNKFINIDRNNTNDINNKHSKKNANNIEQKFEKILGKKRYDIKEADSAFWCFYILKYGYDHYELIYNKHFSIEKELKIKTIEMINKDKSLLKNFKLKHIEIESNLLNDKYTTIESLFALCIYNDVNLFLVKNQTYYEIKVNDDKITNIIHLKDNQFSLEYDSDNTKYLNYYCIENVNKPIKSVSAYKVDELIIICNKLKIDIFKNGIKKKKPELYSDILSKL